MKELLAFEFRKLFRARVLYVCAGVMVLMIVLMIGIDKLSQTGMEAIGLTFEEDELSQEMYSIMGFGFLQSTGLLRMLSALNNIYVIVLFGAFISVFVCGDYGNGVAKNIFTKGYSRAKLFFAKYLTTLAASLGLALLGFLTGFIAGTAFWKAGSGWGLRVIGLLALQLLTICAYNAFFNFLASWLKRVGMTLALSIAIPIILPMIFMLIQLFSELEGSLSKYWLAGNLETFSRLNSDSSALVTGLLISLAYLAVFTVLGWLLSRKREV